MLGNSLLFPKSFTQHDLGFLSIFLEISSISNTICVEIFLLSGSKSVAFWFTAVNSLAFIETLSLSA